MKFIFLNVLLVITLLFSGCGLGGSFNSRLHQIVSPHLFSIAGWEFAALTEEVRGWLSTGPEISANETDTVADYFNNVGRIRSLKSVIQRKEAGEVIILLYPPEKALAELEAKNEVLADAVEAVLEKQIREVLISQGILNPFAASKAVFPPFNFRLEKLPALLVVSPRDRIESMRELTLETGLTIAEKEALEEAVDLLEVSSLVTEIGGIATYPSLVSSHSSLRSTINIATEEWLHQYLVFKPLGFRYLLDVTGISRNYDIATMNETLAGIVSKEIGALVMAEYYSGYLPSGIQTADDGLDFNLEMRKIRQAVDEYLGRGEIEAAEEYMEQKRHYLASEGHYIRKLNQAYFAFHGAYADSPAFENPIGLELEQLRAESESLSHFLNTAAAMTSRQDLKIRVAEGF